MCVHGDGAREREMVCLRLVAFFMALWEEQVCVCVCGVTHGPQTFAQTNTRQVVGPARARAASFEKQVCGPADLNGFAPGI